MYRDSACLCKSNALDLHWNVLWQLLDSNAATSWLVREVLFVDAVHLGKVGHVGDENGGL